MILQLGFPSVVRAQPPRCVSTKQVICTVAVMTEIPERHPDDLPVVARANQEEIRHDGSSFYRKVAQLSDIATLFPEWMRDNGYLAGTFRGLMEDSQGRNNVEYNEHTWPTRERNRPRKAVSYDEVKTFDRVDIDDLDRVDEEVYRLTGEMRVCDGQLWIRCGEPCYRLHLKSDNNIHVEATFLDRDVNPSVQESWMSAMDRDEALAETARIAAVPYRIGEAADIEVIDESLFTTDFTDRAFMKFTYFVVTGIAGYLGANGMHKPGVALMETDPDDVDLWNATRRCLRRMTAHGTSLAGDDEMVMRAADLWSKLGGVSQTPKYCPGPTVDLWFAETVRRWLDRPVSLGTDLGRAVPSL